MLNGARAVSSGRRPGMADHAPSQERWWRGRARRAPFSAFFAFFRLVRPPVIVMPPSLRDSREVAS